MSKPTKHFFIHIPKCSGTTMDNRLAQVEGGYIRYNEPELQQMIAEGKAPQENLIGGHAYITTVEKLGIDFRYFSIIRNPLDRLISYYNYIIQKGEGEQQYAAVKDMNLKQFAEYLTPNEMVRFLLGDQYRDAPFEQIKEAIAKRYYFIGNSDRWDIIDAFLLNEFGIRPQEETHNMGEYPIGKQVDKDTVQWFYGYSENDYKLYNFIGGGYLSGEYFKRFSLNSK